MESFEFRLSSSRVRLAGALFSLVCSAACLTAVLALFASASGELDPALAKLKAAPAASEVATRVPAKPARS